MSAQREKVDQEKEGEEMMPIKLVKLASSDDKLFRVELEVAILSQTIKDMPLERFMAEDRSIPLPNISSQVLAKVLDFCYYHHDRCQTAVPSSALALSLSLSSSTSSAMSSSVNAAQNRYERYNHGQHHQVTPQPSTMAPSSSATGAPSEEALPRHWNAAFLKDQDLSDLCDLVQAASYLNIPSLLELACQAIADIIQECMTGEAIRARFNIVNDFTPKEEAEVRQENQWAFQQ
ncbi:hypothetical protein GOP47_0006825 [Adiantum capillus-veneris]|uniref:SKP1-like protein n=1 Tax=Adiantum capillus-veneris TaxID=13818 RepID=A0A9D4V3L1_ADICA|nr:hypothetical protein GOP47_0006825 [Adiantum capillus-veneris]